MSFWKFAMLSVVLISLQVLRLFLMSIIDGRRVYFVYVSFSSLALGFLIFITVTELSKRLPRVFRIIAENKAAGLLDKVSFHVFLTHCLFCVGTMNVYAAISNIWMATCVYFALASIAATALYLIDKAITKIFKF